MLTCPVKYSQIIVTAFNVIFLLLGVIIFGIGMWAKLSFEEMDSIINSGVISNAAGILITAGVLVMLVSAVGFYATRRKRRKLLSAFGFSILIILVLELAGGLYAFTNRKDVRKQLTSGIYRTVFHGYEGPTPHDQSRTSALNWVQQKLECCGSDGPEDWKTSLWYTTRFHKVGIRVPPSCCVKRFEGCNSGSDIETLADGKLIHSEGCNLRADSYTKRYFTAVGKIGMAIAFVQLIGIALVFCLASGIKKEEKKNSPKEKAPKRKPSSTAAETHLLQPTTVLQDIRPVQYLHHVDRPFIVMAQGQTYY